MEITVKFTVFQDFDFSEELIGPRELGEKAAMEICDILSEHNAAVSYDIVDSNIVAPV